MWAGPLLIGTCLALSSRQPKSALDLVLLNFFFMCSPVFGRNNYLWKITVTQIGLSLIFHMEWEKHTPNLGHVPA